MANRYGSNSQVPQPIRKITVGKNDIYHTLKEGERIDNLAQKYYEDVQEGYVIMCANPDYDSEWEVPVGARLRIPLPLSRVYNEWRIDKEI